MREPGVGQENVRAAVALAAELGHVFIATASGEGLPHVAAAGSVPLDNAGDVRLTEWFCPGTIASLAKNRRVALVARDRESDRGYQLLGPCGARGATAGGAEAGDECGKDRRF